MTMSEVATFFTFSTIFSYVVIMVGALVVFFVTMMQGKNKDHKDQQKFWKFASVACAMLAVPTSVLITYQEFYKKKCNQQSDLFKPQV